MLIIIINIIDIVPFKRPKDCKRWPQSEAKENNFYVTVNGLKFLRPQSEKAYICSMVLCRVASSPSIPSKTIKLYIDQVGLYLNYSAPYDALLRGLYQSSETGPLA